MKTWPRYIIWHQNLDITVQILMERDLNSLKIEN